MAKHYPQLSALAHKAAENLRDAFDADDLPIAFIVAQRSGQLERSSATTGSATSRRASASARRADSLRMTRYWAARRKAGKA